MPAPLRAPQALQRSSCENMGVKRFCTAAAVCVWLDGPSREQVSYPSLVQGVPMQAVVQALAACVRDMHVCAMHARCLRTPCARPSLGIEDRAG